MTRAGVISRVAGSVHRSVRSGRSVEVESVSASERASELRELKVVRWTPLALVVRMRMVSGDGGGLRICCSSGWAAGSQRRGKRTRVGAHTHARHSYGTPAAFLKRLLACESDPPELGLLGTLERWTRWR